MTLRITVLTLAMATIVAGCRGWTTEDPPIVPIRNMYDQPRFDTQEKTSYFPDRRTMRPAVEGTVSREMERDYAVATGRLADDSAWVERTPDVVIARRGGAQTFIERGQERFNIFCAPCHSHAGDGNGMVPRRAQDLNLGYVVTSLHDDRLRTVPDGQIFAVISRGIGRMPPYGASIPVDDRWAIVQYVRALQLTEQYAMGGAK